MHPKNDAPCGIADWFITFHPFYLLVPVFFVEGVVQFREEKKKKAKTFTDETIDYVWLGFFISRAPRPPRSRLAAPAGPILLTIKTLYRMYQRFIIRLIKHWL